VAARGSGRVARNWMNRPCVRSLPPPRFRTVGAPGPRAQTARARRRLRQHLPRDVRDDHHAPRRAQRRRAPRAPRRLLRLFRAPGSPPRPGPDERRPVPSRDRRLRPARRRRARDRHRRHGRRRVRRREAVQAPRAHRRHQGDPPRPPATRGGRSTTRDWPSARLRAPPIHFSARFPRRDRALDAPRAPTIAPSPAPLTRSHSPPHPPLETKRPRRAPTAASPASATRSSSAVGSARFARRRISPSSR
jgi:hypothetical protein